MRLNNKVVITFLICLNFTLSCHAAARENEYVHNFGDFKTHTSVHIQNVQRLALFLYYQYRSTHFSDVPEQVLREKLLSHDFEKLASRENLQKYGYENQKPISERLYLYYGKNKNASSKIVQLIKEINNYEGMSNENLYRKYGLLNDDGTLNEIAQKISLIEKIADLVDREKNPVSPEEFGVEKMLPATEFLDHPMEKALALELAKNYYQVVRQNPLLYIVRHEKEAPQCSALFR
jgi:hypothetical protein